MTQRTFTHDDLEQMASATIAASPFPEAQQKAYAPAVRVLLTALADGRPATAGEMAPGRCLVGTAARQPPLEPCPAGHRHCGLTSSLRFPCDRDHAISACRVLAAV